MKLGTYMYFTGQCEEAVTRYARIFNLKTPEFTRYSEFSKHEGYPEIPAEQQNLVMITMLEFGGFTAMFADRTDLVETKQNFVLTAQVSSEEDGRRIFAELSKNGKVSMELQPTFWSPLYGAVTDQFGTQWNVMVCGENLFNVYINYTGECEAAVNEYSRIFNVEKEKFMKYSDAPSESGTPEIPMEFRDKVLHTELNFENMTLMFSDVMDPIDNSKPASFAISVVDKDEVKLRKIFAEFEKEGKVTMPLQKTFWSPCFGSVLDKFGVEWMISIE